MPSSELLPAVPVKKVLRAGKAFVSAPRTFALELNSGADTGATPMTVSRMIDVSKQMTAGGGQAEIAGGQAARW
jgi:hypothetical protein